MLLERLHDVIFQSNYTNSSVHYRDSFIQKWNEFRSVSQKAKGIHYFTELLGLEWNLTKSHVLQVIPMMTSVIKGRPPGAKGKKYSPNQNTITVVAPLQFQANDVIDTFSVIRLRGFRYIH